MQAIIKEECEIPEGFTGTMLKGHTVVEVKDILPPKYDYLRLEIEAESGEGMTNTGNATICTTLSGTCLKGFKQVTSGHGKYSYGTVFVSGAFMEINVNRYGNDINVTIEKVTVAFPETKREKLWQYEGDEERISLPSKLNKYWQALQAAIVKSHCYHCHCLHFYRED